MSRTGAYAKGVAKREEILARAAELIARDGYHGASIRAIADSVGLSQAGLLHYFDSKEQLFTEILRRRDELNPERFLPSARHIPLTLNSVQEGVIDAARRGSDHSGIAQLFAQLALDASDTSHPAHDFFVERGHSLRTIFAAAVARSQAQGTFPDSIDPIIFARITQAVADGLRLQWMLEPDLDTAEVMTALFRALDRSRGVSEGTDP